MPRSQRAGVHTPHSPTITCRPAAGPRGPHPKVLGTLTTWFDLVATHRLLPWSTGTRTCQARTRPAQRAANPDCQAVSMRSPEAFSHPIMSCRFGSRLRFRKPFFSLAPNQARARAQTPCQSPVPPDATALSGLLDLDAVQCCRPSGLSMQRQGMSMVSVYQETPPGNFRVRTAYHKPPTSRRTD
jgi:hypothetical protein